MKRKVTITFEIDASEYYMVGDTERGTITLIKNMLQQQSDFPSNQPVLIECGKSKEKMRFPV